MESLAAIPWSETYNAISEDDLLGLTDLLHDDASPLFLLPQDVDDDRPTKLPVPGGPAYFGPTIEDIENALSTAPRSKDLQSNTHISHAVTG